MKRKTNILLEIICIVLAFCCCAISASFKDGSEYLYYSSAVYTYEKENGVTRVLMEGHTESSEKGGYYRWSPFVHDFAELAHATVANKKMRNKYFYFENKPEEAEQTVALFEGISLNCRLFFPAYAKCPGSYFGFKSLDGSPILFENEENDTSPIYITESLAEKIVSNIEGADIDSLSGLELDLSSGESTPSFTKKISGIIRNDSVGIYGTLLGNDFVYINYYALAHQFSYIKMGGFLRNDTLENQAALRSSFLSLNSKNAGVTFRLYDYDPLEGFTLGFLQEQKDKLSIVQTSGDLLVPKTVGSVIFAILSCTFFLIALVTQLKGKNEYVGAFYKAFYSRLITSFFALLFSIFLLYEIQMIIRISYVFMPFGTFGMLGILVVFLTYLLFELILCSKGFESHFLGSRSGGTSFIITKDRFEI